MPQTIVLDKIRRLILLKTGIKSISPSDCRFISLSIQKETQKTVSETTLKRLFGFAELKNKFSQYTLNALLAYVEKDGKYELVEKELIQHTNLNEKFGNVQLNAIDITFTTLKNIKHRSSVPYNYTIPRVFARFDFEYFYDSNYSFTAFISQAGYGKSIILSHLVQDLFLNESSKYKKDIILFVTARDIFDDQNEYSNIEDRIKSKIGLSQRTNLTAYFKEKNEKTGIKLVIVIDGFSELITNNASKPIVFDKLINLISSIGDDNFIKIAFSMRSTMWSRFYDRIRNIPFVRKKWFAGTYFNIKDQSNIPPLAIDEIDEILTKIDPINFNALDITFKAKLKYPFFIQWYYLLKEEFPNFDSFTNIVFFEIVDRFIHEKLYNTSYATEKLLFCKKIISLSDDGIGRKFVPKSVLIEDLSNFKNAYRDLLTEGILMEEKIEEDCFVGDFVRFVHPHLFEYFLFIELLNTAKNQMDEKFFESINHRYAGNSNRFQILQWAARLSIIKGNFKALSELLKLKLSNYEKTYLIYFIAENLNYRQYKQASLQPYLEGEELHQTMMQNMIHFDFADSCYKDAIISLLAISKNDKYSFLYLVILAVYDCFGFEKETLLKRIKALQNLEENGENWLVNPLELLKAIQAALSGQYFDNSNLLVEIEAFKSGKKIQVKNEDAMPEYRDMLSFVLMRIYNGISGSLNETTRLLNAMITYYPKMMLSDEVSSAYLFSMMAFIRSMTGLNYEGDVITKIRFKLFHIQSIGNSTPFIESVYLMSKAFESKNDKDYVTAVIYAEKCLELFKRNNLTLLEMSLYKLLIEIYAAKGDEEKKDQYIYQKLHLLDLKGINANIFHKT